MSRPGFFIKRTFEENVIITPEEAGKFFASMDNDEMAIFFNTVADEIKKWRGSFVLQMQYLTDTKHLSDDARFVMETIGDYSKKEH